MMKKKTAVLISGSGSNLQALIDAAKHPDYPAEIALVISNQPDAYGLTRAKNAKIETKIIAHKDFATREAFDAAMQDQLTARGIEIVCLAGFMRLLTPGFVKHWEGRMLNIHPSLLPDFKGGNAIRDALAAKATKTGCSVHFVTAEVDDGPIILQTPVIIHADDTEETLAARIHPLEHIIYPEVLRLLAAGKIGMKKGALFAESAPNPLVY